MFTFLYKWLQKEHALYRQNPPSIAFELVPYLNRGDVFFSPAWNSWDSQAHYALKGRYNDIRTSVMLAKLVTQTACVCVYVDGCLRASLCLLALHKYIYMSVHACTACSSQTAEQVNGSRFFPHVPGRRVRCSPTERMRWTPVQLGLANMPEWNKAWKLSGDLYEMMLQDTCVTETAFSE